eukprot:717396-Pleurochrysis_carterae.AAC.1
MDTQSRSSCARLGSLRTGRKRVRNGCAMRPGRLPSASGTAVRRVRDGASRPFRRLSRPHTRRARRRSAASC